MKDELTSRIVGAVILLEEDKRWTNDGSKNYYIHKLVSDTDSQGVGIKILNLCERMALANGIVADRLDCQASNIKLNKYYERLGYSYVGDVNEGSYIGNRREKKLQNFYH